MMEVDPGYIPRVNGNMIGNFVDKTVLIMAELISIENMRMKIKCCDGSIILAHLTEAITQNLEANTKVQVLAIPKSRSSVNCTDFIVLQDVENTFDMAFYNDTIKKLIDKQDDNSFLIKDLEEHWGATNEKEIDLIDKPEPIQNKQNGMAKANDDDGQMQADSQNFY